MKFKQKGFFFSLASALKPYWSLLHKKVVGKDVGECTNFDATVVLSQRTNDRLWGYW